MSIKVYPHGSEEELKLITFLKEKNYEYINEDDAYYLSDIQKKEILRREEDFKAGKIKTCTIDEIRKHFSL
jgi:hypothetical protein